MVSAAAFFAVKEYCFFIKKREIEYSEIYNLLCRIRVSVESSSAAIGKIAEEIELPALEKNGVLAALREFAADSRKRLRKCPLSIKEEDKNAFFEYFDGFGKNSADEEIKRARKICDRFESRLSEICSCAKKDVKIAWILFCALAVGSLIIII